MGEKNKQTKEIEKESTINIKNIINIFIAILVTFAMNINMDINIDMSDSFSGNSIFYIITFILTYWLFNKIANIKNRRLKIVCIILSVTFTIFELIGNSLNMYMNLNGILDGQIAISKTILRGAGVFAIIYGILFNVFLLLDNKTNKKGKVSWFTDNKKTFFTVWAIIFIAWIPYFLNYFPGVLSPDSIKQTMMTMGVEELTNHHPVFHTLIIHTIMKIGNGLGNYNLGIAIYSISQMIIMSGIFSFSIYYMAKRKVDIKFRVIALIFYAFYPVNALYSITMWKDIIFSGCILIFVIMMVEIAKNREHFMKSKFKNVLLAICMILIILFRNNGIYIIIATMPFMFILAKKNYKKIIVISLIVISFYMILKGPIFSIFNIKEGSTKEALSIPLQQFARISKEHGDTLSQEDKWRIYKYLPVENIGQYYNPTISDDVKDNFDDEAFENDKIGIIKLWAKLFVKYPRTTIEAFLCNNYGYYYPGAVHWVVERGIADLEVEEIDKLNLKSEPIVELKAVQNLDEMIDRRDLPLNSMIYSIGFTVWISITMFGYIIYKKKYRLILIYIPIGILWLTCMASPVFCEFRYIYALFISMPVLIGINLAEDKEKEELSIK